MLRLQVGLLLASLVIALGVVDRVAAETLSDAGAVVLTLCGFGAVVVATVIAAWSVSASRRTVRGRLPFAIVPTALFALCGLFARSIYPETSVEMQALAAAKAPSEGVQTALEIGPGGRDVRLSGEIVEGTAQRLDALLAGHPDVERIHLTSEGGLADEGQSIGDVIAAHELATYVSDFCVSACTLAFVRGQERFVMEGARLGFHGPFQEGLFGRTFAGETEAVKAAYVEAGVQPDFADEALKVSPDDMWFPPAGRLLAAHVATAVVSRTRFPDSNLDGHATLAGSRAEIVGNFPVLQAFADTSPKVLDAVAASYLDAYRRGGSEGDNVRQLRALIRSAVAVSLAQADDATAAAIAGYLAKALRVARSPEPCAAIAEHADLVEAERQLAVADKGADAAAVDLVRRSIRAHEAPALAPRTVGPGHAVAADECKIVRATYAALLDETPATIAAHIRALLAAQAVAALAATAAFPVAAR